MAEAAASKPFRIDTHHHILPPAYVAEERERVLKAAATIPATVLEWTPARAIEEMDRHRVATGIVSISTPGVYFGDRDSGRRLSRLCNEYGAQMARDYPGRFGMFAAIPLPDIEGSLREIEYALDVLKLDGIGLMTNYGETWPGDPAYDAVFDELNRRKSIVYFHPTAPTCCPNVPGIGAPLIEYPTDTTRCITNLLFTGTLSRCPDLRFIFSHGGGTLPMVLSRILGALKRPVLKDVAARIPKGALHEFAKLYYDTTSVTNRPVLAALKEFVPTTQLLFGTDYPYWPIAVNADGLQELGLSQEVLRMIERENALRLFPRFA